jgi:hypothetical protein
MFPWRSPACLDRQQNSATCPFCTVFLKPSDGLEPSTPPYHRGFGEGLGIPGNRAPASYSLHSAVLPVSLTPSSKRPRRPRERRNPSPEPVPSGDRRGPPCVCSEANASKTAAPPTERSRPVTEATATIMNCRHHHPSMVGRSDESTFPRGVESRSSPVWSDARLLPGSARVRSASGDSVPSVGPSEGWLAQEAQSVAVAPSARS